MAVEPRRFQSASIDAAVAALDRDSRRFLVADEVGLGKTVVASGVVRAMCKGRSSPLTVFYVCSNSLLAHQNLGRLADFLTEGERKRAVSMVDRPSLMPTSDKPPDHPAVRLYSLSPGTALARGGGRVEERAFAAALLRKVLSGKMPGLEPGLRLNANAATFKRHLRRYRDQLDDGTIGGDGLVERFRKSLRRELNLDANQQLPSALEKRMDDFHRLASTLRAALAIAAIDAIRPDLVIFDEFQRFRDLVDPDSEESEEDNDAAARVLNAIRDKGAAILLLSATPYVPYRGRSGVGETSTESDFHELVEFLGGKRGKEIRGAVEKAFATLNAELRKNVPDAAKVSECRRTLEELLRPLMCRTERSRVGHDATAAEICRADLTPQDVQGFRGFAEALRQDHPEWVVPLWSSVPLPLQSLGQRYTAWKAADWSKADSAIALTERQRNGFQAPNVLPHPRLRALLEAMPREQLGLPWIAPSRPWWPLAGGWANRSGRIDGKLLVFSRFRATPASVAGLVSYELEASRREARQTRDGSTVGWATFAHRRPLAADPKRPGLLALFHPSPLLTVLDPLRARGSAVEDLRESMFDQLVEQLSAVKVKVEDSDRGNRQRAEWQLIVALEERMGLWPQSLAIWTDVVSAVKDERSEPGAGTRLASMVERWNDARHEDVTTIGRDEAKLLADFALEAPGAVLARALGRHWPEALEGERAVATDCSWGALRSYLNNPLFAELLGEQQEGRYPDALRRAVREGNLESVLDEHFWYLAQSDSKSWQERLEEFSSALRLRKGNALLHESAEKSFSLRCHTAMAMTEARAARDEDGEKPVRPDEVRRAFNTPFWPHILVTTSVGQEGLDFHPWCRALAHWDPPSGPVALEQREGRITRYAGLNVRRTLGTWGSDIAVDRGESPWTAIARSATEKLSDESGLRPWWTPDGASNVQRLLMAANNSEVESIMSRLARERALYRLVLGMPDQADLLALLMSRDSEKIDPKLVCIDLAAMRGAEL